MPKVRTTSFLLASICVFVAAAPTRAQDRVRFSTQTGNGAFQPGTASPAPAFTQPNGTNLTPVTPPARTTPGGAAPGATLQTPTFDPFATESGAATAAPTLIQPGQTFGGQPAPGFAAPGGPVSPGYPGYPQQPGVLYPNGPTFFGQNGMIGTPQPGPYLKLFQDVRLIGTWLDGGGGANDVDIIDVEAAVTMNIANFLHSGQPLRISPGFIFHFWQGPVTPPADLPSRAYSAYVEFDWITNTQRRLGGEIDFIAGLYTDFQTLTTDSLRFQGTGLGWFKFTDRLILKFGVTYLDRNDIKLLPAGGLFWTPNEDVRFELYFPRPKLAQRLTTWGLTDIWWYVGAEYGGGSWTIERATTLMSEQVDINDIRVFGGIEWFSESHPVSGFIEGGYVFDRELVYAVGPPVVLGLKDTFFIRGGIAF